MVASELRIGNIVFCEYLNTNGKVCEIKEYCVWLKYPNGAMSSLSPIHELQPIPLTEEWLVKINVFPKNIEFKELTKKVKINLCLAFVLDISKDGVYFGETHIKHVHQLQNLYFCLTSEELILK